MAKLLIVFGTTEGHTERIADVMGMTLTAQGHDVDVLAADEAPGGERLAAYDGVIAGSSVHVHKFNEVFRDWVSWNAPRLGRAPSAFFAVCLGILENDPKTQDAEKTIVSDFLAETGWRPDARAIFAGALLYSRYGWVKRLVMRAIVKRAGGDTDTSRDYDYTDWDAVRGFARRFGNRFAKASKQPAAGKMA